MGRVVTGIAGVVGLAVFLAVGCGPKSPPAPAPSPAPDAVAPAIDVAASTPLESDVPAAAADVSAAGPDVSEPIVEEDVPAEPPTVPDAVQAPDVTVDAQVAAAPSASPAAPTTRRLSPKGLDARAPRFDPTGKRVAFHAGPPDARDIYVMNVDGTNVTKLTSHPADDIHPAWAADGERILWSTKREGTYDIVFREVTDEPGSPVTHITKGGGDELEVTMSPLTYTFSAVMHSSCSNSGAYGQEVDRYEKVVFTNLDRKGRSSIWFKSLNGDHKGLLSKSGQTCRGPRYSGDGLSISWSCEAGAGEAGTAAAVGSRVVVHDTRARWDQTFADALTAVGWSGDAADEPDRGCEEDVVEEWATDPCLKALPKRYAKHARNAVSEPADGYAARGYSANQTLVVARGPGGLATRTRVKKAAWKPLAAGGSESTSTRGAVAADWAPDGARVAVEQRVADGTHAIFLADTSYYLQDVRNLNEYPELWGPRNRGVGRSEGLARNRFVARTGREKEFFTAYEKVRYARRGGFVTTDAALQVVRDEFAGLLKLAEKDAMASLLALCEGLMNEYVRRAGLAGSKTTAMDRYLAEHFGFGWAVLSAATGVKGADDQDFFEEPEEAPAAPIDELRKRLPGVIEKLPESIRKRVGDLATRALAHEGIAEVPMPAADGRPGGAKNVDFSQMKVRGHYAASALAGYFVAMKWYAMVPMPLDAAADLVRFVDGGPLVKHYERVDGLVAAFMGQPVDITLSHVRRLLKDNAAVLTPKLDRVAASEAFARMLGDLGIRGLDAALAADGGEGKGDGTVASPPEPAFMLFPLRLGVDVKAYSGLTHPAVPMRGMPSSLDAMAMLGAPAANRIQRAKAEAAEWQAEYRTKLDALVGKTARTDAAFWSTDLYHSWLALLATMSRPEKIEARAELLFAANEAWEDRLLNGALAGYAQLKHDSVLYAFQDFSAECDSETPVLVYIEQPVLPEPKGFVEPAPAFFRAAAAFAKRTYEVLADGEEPEVQQPMWDEEKPGLLNGRIFAEKLAEIAEAEVAGKAPTAEQQAWLAYTGGRLEGLFFGQDTKDTTPMFGADEGRMKRGVSLVTDIHTNVTRRQALHIAIGRLDRLYVAVPDLAGTGSLMTEGAAFSFYEFPHDMSDRLTDEQWGEQVEAAKEPPRPDWTASYLEVVPFTPPAKATP